MKSYFVSGLIQVLIIYTTFYLLNFLSYKFYDFRILPLISLSCLLGVYILGIFHLRLINLPWISLIWHLIYVSGLLIYIPLTFFDCYYGPLSYVTRGMLKQIHEFLISPVLYLGLGLFTKIFTNTLD